MESKKTVLGSSVHFLSQNAIFVVLVVLVLLIAVVDPRFLSFAILRDVLMQSSTRAIMALGVAFILITGGVDLSSGVWVSFAAVIAASISDARVCAAFLPRPSAFACFLPIILAVAACMLFGMLNGLIVAKLRCLRSLRRRYDGRRLRNQLVYFTCAIIQPIGGLRPVLPRSVPAGS